MPEYNKYMSNGVSVILVLAGCILLFSAEILTLNIIGALLMAVGLWGLIR